MSLPLTLTPLSPPPPPPLALQTPDQISVTAVAAPAQPELRVPALLLGAPDPVLQAVPVSALSPVSPSPLPHPLVGSVVPHIALVLLGHVIMIQSLEHVGVDPSVVVGRVILDSEEAPVPGLDVLGLSGLGLRGPALERVREADTVHGDLGPVWLGEDGVGDAGGREHRRHRLQRLPDVAALVVDEVPLGLGHRGAHIVSRHLSLVKLPLEDEHRS